MALIKSQALINQGLITPDVTVLGIYELSQKQYDILRNTANDEHIVFSVIGVAEGATDHEKEEIEDTLRQIKELIGMGLVNDVSDKFESNIKKVKEEHGRTIYLYALTWDAVLMFLNKKESVN